MAFVSDAPSVCTRPRLFTALATMDTASRAMNSAMVCTPYHVNACNTRHASVILKLHTFIYAYVRVVCDALWSDLSLTATTYSQVPRLIKCHSLCSKYSDPLLKPYQKSCIVNVSNIFKSDDKVTLTHVQATALHHIDAFVAAAAVRILVQYAWEYHSSHAYGHMGCCWCVFLRITG